MRSRWTAVLAVVVLAGCGGAKKPSPTPAPTETSTPAPSPAPTATPKPRPTPIASWPMYGRTADRRRFLDVNLEPPFRTRWTFQAGALLEFPPSMRGNALYSLSDAGDLFRLDKRTGEVRWKRHLGELAASSPAVTKDRVIITILERSGAYAGRVLAVKPSNGAIVWSRDLPARTESSPVIDGKYVYFGAENGTIYALKQSNGAVRWTFQAAGAVKAGLALARGRLYVGDYAGRVYAIGADDGNLAWSASGNGRFYSTPAVGEGRVVLGTVSGSVFAYDIRSGGLAWSVGTGGYVYSSPAIGPGPGGRPTVFIGSYDGLLYAIDLRTGAVRWRASAGGSISGGASVIGRIVYVSTFRSRTTSGFDVRTGRRVAFYPRGAYNPAIADRDALYLTGAGSVRRLEEKPKKKRRHAPRRPGRRGRARGGQ